MTGLDRANAEAILQATSNGLVEADSYIFVGLQSRQCPNLQNALKNLIKIAIVERSGAGAYNDFLAKHKKFHPLNFDLELLELFITDNTITKIVVSLSDVEDVDASTTNDLINTLQLWQGQIPSVLLLGITSTRDLFEHRLSKSCLKHLDTSTFDFTPSIDQNSSFLRAIQSSSLDGDEKSRVFLGPSVMKVLHDLSQGQGNNAQSLKASLQYLCLSHFVADPISSFCDLDDVIPDDSSATIATSIARSTASFKQFCEDVLAEKNKTATARVKKLLNDDQAVLTEVRERVKEGMAAYTTVSHLIYSFSDFYQALSRFVPKIQKPRLEIELQLYQTMEDLTNCEAVDNVRNGVLSIDQQRLGEILRACDSSVITNLGLQNLLPLLKKDTSIATSSPLQTNEFHDTNINPTPNSKRGKSAKTPKTSTKSVKQGGVSLLAQNFVDTLERKLQLSSLDVSSLLLHEAYILSSRTIRFKQNFDAQPRSAIERALLRPGDYLTCDCCSEHQRDNAHPDESGEDEMTTREAPKYSMPPACILFTLLQEAPTIINVRDLFDAFSSHLNRTTNTGGTAVEAEEERSRRTMTLFYRALAELKMIGLIKASAGTQIKKRTAGGRASKAVAQDVDFIAKTSWAGS